MTDLAPIATIVLGWDGSPGSVAARAVALRMAAATGAEVVVIRAYSPLDELAGHPEGVSFPDLRDAARLALAEEVCAPFVAAGIACRSELVERQPPHQVLVDAARSYGADLLVVGTHGITGWRERVMGGVAAKLLLAAPCPVTVVPPPR